MNSHLLRPQPGCSKAFGVLLAQLRRAKLSQEQQIAGAN